MTKVTQKVAGGLLTGVVKVSGYVTGSVVNSKVGKKFFGFLPGEVLLASLDGFSKSKIHLSVLCVSPRGSDDVFLHSVQRVHRFKLWIRSFVVKTDVKILS